MGWQNPEIPWRELERRLSGRPPPIGDGGDSPAWSRKRDDYEPLHLPRVASSTPFAELHAHSSFSFLDGASGPEELAEEAARLGLESLTLTDHDGMYGVVRFAEAAREIGLTTGFGAELSLGLPPPRNQEERLRAARVGVPDPPGQHLLALARDPGGYASLCRTISTAQLRGGAKGRPVYDLDEVTDAADGHWLVLTGCRKGSVRTALESGGERAARRALDELVARFGRDNVAVELTYELDPRADERYDVLAGLAHDARLPIVATTAAHYHAPPRRPLATALAAVRARSSLDEIDGWLPSWAGQHLRSGDEMAERFARWPDAITQATRLGKEIGFSLHLIAPDLPPFPVPAGHDEMSYLRELVHRLAPQRFAGKPHERRAYEMIEHELEIIEELHFPGYFLVVYDIARFCREQGILAQGRGSAANSAVCYALQITAIDAVYYDLMFERFLAPERGEPPDIDIDIESDRREEVIQYVYELHGREHAAQVANVITYRPKSAVRDVAKALGYSPGQQDAWSKEIERGYYWSTRDRGRHRRHPAARRPALGRVAELPTAPGDPLRRHGHVRPSRRRGVPGRVGPDGEPLSPAVGQGRLRRDRAGQVRPAGTGDALGAALRLRPDHRRARRHVRPRLHPEGGAVRVRDAVRRGLDRGVPGRVARADRDAATVETELLLRPRHRGGADPARADPGRLGAPVHPAQARRGADHLRPSVAEGTARPDPGRPAVPGAADADRRRGRRLHPGRGGPVASRDGVETVKDKIDAMRIRLYDGMAAKGITGSVADEIFEKIKAFAAFGFAESHSISFALLVYASSWLKRHYPAAFCAALLNAQPMGFYSPQSLVHDAKRHGVEVRKPSLLHSASAATLEPSDGARRSAPAWTRRSRPSGSACRPSAPSAPTSPARSSPNASGRPVLVHGRPRAPRRVVRRPGRGARHRRRVRGLRRRAPRRAVGGRRSGLVPSRTARPRRARRGRRRPASRR